MPTPNQAGNLGTVWPLLLGVIAIFGKRAGRTIALAGLFAPVPGCAASEMLKELTVRLRPFASLPDVRLPAPSQPPPAWWWQPGDLQNEWPPSGLGMCGVCLRPDGSPMRRGYWKRAGKPDRSEKKGSLRVEVSEVQY